MSMINERILLTLSRIERSLNSINQALRPETTATTIEFTTIIQGLKQKVDNMFLMPDMDLPLALVITDANGNAAKVDGAPQWAMSDNSFADLRVEADGMSGVIVPNGKAGKFTVQVKADADMGEGVKEILGEMEIEVMSAMAFKVEIVAGTPVPKAPVEPVPVDPAPVDPAPVDPVPVA